MPFLIFLGVCFILLMWVVGIYNGLVRKRNGFKNAFSQIDVQLKRRHDLIPNLVETAKGYMKFERETLEAVISARNQAVKATDKVSSDPANPELMKQHLSAEGVLAGAMSRFMAVAEQYPDLKANQNMMSLQEELSSTENRVSFARQAYNDAAMTYNNAREIFPNNLISGIFNFQAAVFYEIEEAADRAVPKVGF